MLNFLLAAAGALILDEEGPQVQNTIGAVLLGVGLSRALSDALED